MRACSYSKHAFPLLPLSSERSSEGNYLQIITKDAEAAAIAAGYFAQKHAR